MGIRGLTTFIQNRSHLFMERYELHDSNIVIDGNAIACQLYNWHTRSNDCFGGDYDNYGEVVSKFYQLLFQCQVTPFVVFDGGYESRKIGTVITRLKNRIKTAHKLDCNTGGSASVFPLFLRETFLDITLKLGVKVVRCDFESDTETANIARALDCPVLSYDSDFFIFDVLYIPFSTFELSLKHGKQNRYKYISCEVYRVEKFLNSYGQLDKENLPILAVLLGNDYVKRSVFSMFYQNLKMQKCHGSEVQKRIKSLMVWLQNETQTSAISKVLGRFKSYKRKLIANKIQKAMEGYNCYDSMYLKYLGVKPSASKVRKKQIDFDCLIKNADETKTEETELEVSSQEETNTDEDDVVEDYTDSMTKTNISPHFFECFRKCLYPACFMDIVVQNKYYCIPQVEDYSLDQSHNVSLELISAIHKLLTNSDENMGCVVRIESTNVGTVKIPLYSRNLPDLTEILMQNEDARKNTLLIILGLQDADLLQFLGSIPKSWHLFILSILYLIGKSDISWPLIYSLILCRLILGHVDTIVGFYRSLTKLVKKYGNVNPNSNTTLASSSINMSNLFDNLSLEDSVNCLRTSLIFFQVDAKLQRNYKLFNRTLVHSISQFQSCLLHVRYLNALLQSPFENCIMSECINCTFIYNLATNFSKRTNIKGYMEMLFKDSKTILNIVQFIINELENFSLDRVVQRIPAKRRKKKKKTNKTKSLSEDSEPDFDCEEDALYDPNNKFTILSCS